MQDTIDTITSTVIIATIIIAMIVMGLVVNAVFLGLEGVDVPGMKPDLTAMVLDNVPWFFYAGGLFIGCVVAWRVIRSFRRVNYNDVVPQIVYYRR